MNDPNIKFIANGTYGCVFSSAISCLSEESIDTNKETKKYVSKVTIRKDGDREIELGKIIMNEIFQYDFFFAPIIGSCPIDIGLIKEEEIQQCPLIKENKDRKVVYVSNKMKFVGNKSTFDYLETIKKGQIKSLLESHLHLTKALSKLLLLNDPIIHYDLKDNNIMFDDLYNVPIIIDFGLSFTESKIISGLKNPLKLGNYFYIDESYSPWTIEIHLLSYIAQKIILNDNEQINIDNELLNHYLDTLVDVVDKFITSSSKEIYKFDKKKYEFRQNMIDYLTSFKLKPIIFLVTDLIKSFKTWDNYSIAVMYNNYLSYADIDRVNPYIIAYKNLLDSIIFATPLSQRIEPKQLYDKIIELCNVTF